MPYRIEYRPVKGKDPWAKIKSETGEIVSRHKTKAKAKASIAAYYATRNEACACHARMILNARLMRGDPTRTLGIQRRWIAETRRRVRKLMTAIREFLVEEDELALKERTTLIRLERTYEFRTDAGKVQAFQSWFAQQVQADVLSVPAGVDPTRPWLADYVDSSYRRGLTNAYLSSKEADLTGQVGEQSQEAFLRSAFAAPETISKLQLAYTRAYGDLKGFTDAMAAETSRLVAQGIADGLNPRTIARQMQERMASLSRTRAEVIARTETIRIHAEGQLDAFEKLGVEELGLRAEWSTAGDDRVCPDCAANEGEVFTVDQARNLIPLHPNCRCTWIPAIGEGPPEQPAAGPPAWDDWNDSDSMLDILSEEETNQLTDYVGDSAWLNNSLRSGGDLAPARKEMRDTIDSVFTKAPVLQNEVTVYRQIEKSILEEQIGTGTGFTDKGFVSTSVRKSASDQLQREMKEAGVDSATMKIRLPAGSKGLKLDSINSDFAYQDELLLPRGGKFTLTAKKGDVYEFTYEPPRR